MALRAWAGALFAVCRSPLAASRASLAGPAPHHPELLVGEHATECILTGTLHGGAPVGDVAHRVAVAILDRAQRGPLFSGERRHLRSLALHHLLTHLRAIAGCGCGWGRGLGGERRGKCEGREGQGERFHGVILHLVRERACGP